MRIIIYFFSLCAITISSHAALTLTVNSDAKTFALTGSDTGTPQGDLTRVWQFRITGLGGTSTSSVSYDNDVAFSTSEGTPGQTSFDTVITGNGDAGGTILFTLAVSDNVSQTVTGSGVFQSYAALSADNETQLESLNGQTISREFGFGFSDLSVTVVPEAHHYSIIGGLLCIGLGVWRKNRKSAAPVIG